MGETQIMHLFMREKNAQNSVNCILKVLLFNRVISNVEVSHFDPTTKRQLFTKFLLEDVECPG